MRRSLGMFYVIDEVDTFKHYVMDDFGNLVRPDLEGSCFFILGE